MVNNSFIQKNNNNNLHITVYRVYSWPQSICPFRAKPLNASTRDASLIDHRPGRSLSLSLSLSPVQAHPSSSVLRYTFGGLSLRNPHYTIPDAFASPLINFVSAMAKGTPAASSPTTATPPSGALKRTTSSSQNMKSQKSILGFFQKSSPSTPSTAARHAEPASSPAERVSEQRGANATRETSKTPKTKKAPKFSQDLTPVPSSDLVGPEEEEEKEANGQVCC